jgi:DNA-binding GntR family transcriptional regulator
MVSKNDSPTQIPRETFASMVGERIRASVLDGTLPPGSQLNEVALAASYGVSRGPVREALQRLIQEGLLRSAPHRGVFVPVMSSEDIDDIYFARQALETAAIRRIVGTPQAASGCKTLDRLVRAMRQAEAAGDWESVASRDFDFHIGLVSAAGSPRLERMFTAVISETRLCMSVLTAADGRRDDLVDEHERVTELIREGDTEGAVAVLQKHFDDAVVTLNRHLPGAGGGEETAG